MNSSMALPTLVPTLNSSKCFLLSFANPPSKIFVHDFFASPSNIIKHSANLIQASRRPQPCLASKNNQEAYRPLANFAPTIWKDPNIFTSEIPHSEIGSNDKLAEELKQQVKEMLIASTGDPMEKVCLIDSICRLGVSYHFETEIEEQLNQIFEAQPNFVDDKDYDLYSVALMFRVFRQHGYKMSCGVFNKFKESNGMFKENISSYVKGLLSLYEATHLRVHGEDILEEALDFTTALLKSLAKTSPDHLARHIIDALEMPFHRGVPRLETHKYICFYQEDLDKNRNETLLMFAKLEFNRLQLLHRAELSYLKSWWEDLDLTSKYSYSRDRIVEVYFWAYCLYFEPCYSRARIILAQVLMLHTIVDDTYDAYGTLEELQLFTTAIQRWDINALGNLPDYMKLLYTTLLNFYDELEDEESKEGRSYCVSCMKDTIKELLKVSLLEAEWFRKGFVPPFEERLNSELAPAGSISFYAATYFVGLGVAGIKEFKWLKSDPKIVRAAYIIGRLQCDIVSHEDEQKRGHIASTVECCMKEYGFSKEETVEKFKRIISDGWKDVNEECMKPTAVSSRVLITLVNSARVIEIFYKDKDGVTCPEALKDYITKLIIHPIPI